MRNALLAFIILALIVALVGAWETGFQPMQVQMRVETLPPVVMGVIPYLSPDELKNEFNPILNYLSRKLNRPFTLNVAADYESLARLMDLKMVHVAWFSDTSLQLLGAGKPWEILCRPVQNGRVSYFGKIITRIDKPYDRVEDLASHSFAFVDRFSGSGYYFPNLLFKSKGINPLAFFSKVYFTHSHESSIDGVIAGDYDAAAVFSVNINSKYSEKIKQLKFLASTGPIPNDPVVIQTDFSPELKKQILDALLLVHTDPDWSKGMQQSTMLRSTSKFIREAEAQARLTDEAISSGNSRLEPDTPRNDAPSMAFPGYTPHRGETPLNNVPAGHFRESSPSVDNTPLPGSATAPLE